MYQLSDSVTTVSGLIELINASFAASDVYHFSSLLHHSQIEELKRADPRLYMKLKIFSYGTYQDILINRIEVSAVELLKIHQLTICEAVSSCDEIRASDLMELLKIYNDMELQRLLTTCFGQKLISGEYHPASRLLRATSLVQRDVAPEELPWLETLLNEWIKRNEKQLQLLETPLE